MRRANGTGSITRLGGNRRKPYAVRVSYLDPDGIQKQKYIAYCHTRKEAQQILDQYNSEHPEGTFPPSVPVAQVPESQIPAAATQPVLQPPAGSGMMAMTPPPLCPGSLMQNIAASETYVKLPDGRLAVVPAGQLQVIGGIAQVPAACIGTVLPGAGTGQQQPAGQTLQSGSPLQAGIPAAAQTPVSPMMPAASPVQAPNILSSQRLPTVNDMYEIWAKTYRSKWAKSTADGYEWCYRKHFTDVRDLPVKDVTIDILQNFFDAKAAAGQGDSSLNEMRKIWNGIMKEALKRDYIVRNRVSDVVLSRQGAVRPRSSISEESIEKLFKIAESYEVTGNRSIFTSSADDFADVALIYVYTGFRERGLMEMTAESWHPAEDGFLPYLKGGIKTDAGRNRIVPVHPRIQHFVETRIQTYGGLTTFGKYADGRQPAATILRTKIKRVLVAAGCDSNVSVHWLRHTFASRLSNTETKEIVIKVLMGHALSDITEHYTHVSHKQLDEAVLRLP